MTRAPTHPATATGPAVGQPIDRVDGAVKTTGAAECGRALTSRRYDHLWKRMGQQLPCVAAQGISTHWLRHTT